MDKTDKGGYTELENWFYATTSKWFCVDIGNMRIDCKGIEINDLHIVLYLELGLGECEHFTFPLSKLVKCNIHLW